ncbi:14578_t:CDS:1, partial [Gigaspora margarita]
MNKLNLKRKISDPTHPNPYQLVTRIIRVEKELLTWVTTQVAWNDQMIAEGHL